MLYKREYVWALVGRFLPLLIYFVTTMILARFLSPEDFGKIGVLSIFFVVANTLMDAGLGGSLVKETELTQIDCSTIFVFNISVSVVLYAVLYFISGGLEVYFGVGGLSMITKVLCLIFVINAWGLVPRSLLTRSLKFKTLTIINVVAVIIAAFVSILMAIFGFGVYALVGYQLVNAIAGAVLAVFASKFFISFRFSWGSLRRLIPFGVFTTLSTVIDTVYENLITFLFGKYLNMLQAGYLYQAKRLEEVPSQTVATTISSVAFPVLTRLRNEPKPFASECNNTFKNVMLLTLPILTVVGVFADPILWTAFGEQWRPAAPYLTLLAIAAVFHIAESLNRAFIKSTTQVEKLFSITLWKRITGVAVIFACLLVNPRYVLIGYIFSTFVGYIFNLVLLTRVTDLTFGGQIRQLVTFSVPCVIYVVFMSVIMHFCSLMVQISIGGLMVVAYYLIVLRLYGIKIDVKKCRNILRQKL